MSDTVKTIEPAELKLMMERSEALVLDVRDPDEFEGPRGHVPGARNLPVADMPGAQEEIAQAKDEPVATMSGSAGRSERAARLMAGADFRRVLVLRGGLEAWRAAGLPVEGGGPLEE